MKGMLRHRRDKPVPQHTLRQGLLGSVPRGDTRSFSFETTATCFALMAFALVAAAAHPTPHERQADWKGPVETWLRKQT